MNLESINESVYLARIKLMFDGLVVSQTGIFLAGGILVYALKDVIPLKHLMIWLGCLLITIAYRLIIRSLYYSAVQQGAYSGQKMEARFIFGVLISSIVWGSSGVFLYPESSLVHQTILQLLLLGLAGTSLGTLTPSFKSVVIFMTISISPIIVSILLAAAENSLTLALFGLLFLGAAIANGQRFNQNIKETLLLRHRTKLNQIKLAASDDKYRLLYEKSEDAMMLITGSHFFMANDAAVKLLGYGSVEKLLNTPPFDLCPESQPNGKSSKQQAREIMEKALKMGHYRLEWLVKTIDDHVIPVDVTLTAIEFGNKRAILCVGRDISETKKLEQQMIAATQAKSEFLANMSHEIRTPMNGVIGINELMLQDDLSDKQKSRAQTIKNSANSMLSIINDILDFSKIEAGKLDIECHDFNFTDFMDDFLSSISTTVKDKGLSLNCNIDSAINGYYQGDEGRIRQILNNLVGNAVKFTEQGGVDIDCRLLRTSEECTMIRFDVSDTGVGIDDEKKKIIFERFTQADSSTTRMYGGTGLGLSICKELTVLMGGEIGFESQVNQGSNFWFTVRLDRNNNAEKNMSENSNQEHGFEHFKGRVLVVDDNATNLLVARGILEFLGLEVETLVNGQEALDILQETHFDLIFMDCHMPVMDGYIATQNIRKLKSPVNKRSIPIIAFTASAMKGDREKCLAAGMDDYLTKPMNVVTVQKKLKVWMADYQEDTIDEAKNEEKPEKVKSSELNLAFDYEELKEWLSGNTKLMIKVVKEFFINSNKSTQLLRMAVEQKDFEQVVLIAHELKGASASVGLKMVNQLMAGIETAARAEDMIHIERFVNEIDPCFKRSIKESSEQLECSMMRWL